MTVRATLWVAFVVVHTVVAVLGWVLPNEPMGDVYRVYQPWSTAALDGAVIVGVDAAWVYPQLALLPMLAAHLPAALVGNYVVGWAIVVTALDAAAFALLVGRGQARGRRTAAWFWLAAVLALGPVGLYRIDAVTVPLAIAGCLWLIGRPWLASALLAAATWMKVWPAALLAAALIAVRRRVAIVGGAAVVSAVVVAGVAALGGLAYVLGFVGDQTGRGLQVESPIAGFYLWGAMLGIPGFSVYYSQDLLTFQVTGTEIDPVIAAMTPVLALIAAALVVLGAVQAWRGARFVTLFPPLALALVTALFAANKVGSPQFACWLIAPTVFALVVDRRRWRGPALLVLALAALTQLVYPLLYGQVLGAAASGVIVLTVRNVGLVVMLVWMTVRLVRVPAARRVARGAGAPASATPL